MSSDIPASRDIARLPGSLGKSAPALDLDDEGDGAAMEAGPKRKALGPARNPSPMSLKRMLRWGIQIVRGNPHLFVFATVLATGVTLLTQANAWLVTQVVNAVSQRNLLDGRLSELSVAFVVTAISLIPLQFLARIASVWCNTAMTTSLQQILHDRLLAQSAEWHDRRGLGETTSVVMQFAPASVELLRDLIAFPLVHGLTLGTAILLLIGQVNTISALPLWANIALVFVLVVLPVGGWLLAKRTEDAFRHVRAAREAVSTEYINSASRPIEVKVLGATLQRGRNFGRRLASLQTVQRRASLQLELANQFQSMVPALLTTSLLVFAVLSIAAAPDVEVGPILGIYMLVPMVTGPITEIVSTFTGWSSAWPMISKVGELLDAKPEARTGSDILPDGPLNLALDGVHFAYKNRPAPVLAGVSFEFPAGHITAVVGRAGSGKSSMLGLLSGLRYPSVGRILIDGKNIETLSADTVRGAVGVVSQFPLFVDDTIRENFRLAKDSVLDVEILDVARETGLWRILVEHASSQGLSAERALDAMMGREPGQGHGMSGGQRRLFAIARVLLRRPQVLILDEPMTGIDNPSIEAILSCLQRLRHDCTIVLIEHNMSVVQGLADLVCCLDEGRFLDVGTPAALATTPTLFKELLDAQARISKVRDMEITSVPLPTLAVGNS